MRHFDNGQMLLRYDLACMRPASKRGKLMAERLEALIASSAPERLSWERGQLLVIDNYRMLHARGPAVVTDKDRVLIRILVGGKQ
jgi:hypothetical protein